MATRLCAQGTPPQLIENAQDKLKALSWLEGEWTGSSWMQMGPDRRESAGVREIAEFRLDGTLLLLEGRGTTDEGAVVHSAVGVISVDPATGDYAMRAYRPGGVYVDADLEVTDSGLVWGFDNPHAGRIRYTVTHDEADNWVEHGEISRDGGQTWLPFFGMTLSRLRD